MTWTDEKTIFTHKEAIEKVYELTPQIKDYDRFMHIGARWLPYTMYFHEKNFNSTAVNTDELGFRYSWLQGERYSMAQFPAHKTINLLVGGSTALGVGSTNDKFTVSSFLCEQTGEIWLNFSGRGYNATQELIMFLMHQKRFRNIGKVIVLSGMNTLALEGIPDELASEHGRYYYSYEFQHYMNLYNEDMKSQTNNFSSHQKVPFWQRVKAFFNTENPADKIITDEKVPLNARVVRAANATADALYQWKLLLADFNAELSFVLQPLAYWTRDHLTTDEQAVFRAIDHCPNNFYRLFSGVLGKEVHQPYFDAIRKVATQHNIPCHDMNQLLATSSHIEETLFVDRVHFNDLGNKELANLLVQEVLTSI